MEKKEIQIQSLADFGAVIRQVRLARGLSQVKLAELIKTTQGMNCTQRDISRWEGKKNVVNQANFLKALNSRNFKASTRFSTIVDFYSTVTSVNRTKTRVSAKYSVYC